VRRNVLYELAPRVAVIPGTTNVGVILTGPDSCFLVDVGLDRQRARQIARILHSEGLEVRGVLLTHCHADHCGGLAGLLRDFGRAVEVKCTSYEATILANPIFAPLALFGGASPPRELKNKFLMPERVEEITLVAPGDQLQLGEVRVEVLDLAGHTPGQVGYAIEEVLFCGDAYFGRDVLDKHGIPFFVDIERSLEAMAGVERGKWRWVVPSHGEVVEPARALEDIEHNRSRLSRIADYITRALSQRQLTAAELTHKLCLEWGTWPIAPAQFHLYRCAILAHLSRLYDRGAVRMAVYEKGVIWSAG